MPRRASLQGQRSCVRSLPCYISAPYSKCRPLSPGKKSQTSLSIVNNCLCLHSFVSSKKYILSSFAGDRCSHSSANVEKLSAFVVPFTKYHVFNYNFSENYLSTWKCLKLMFKTQCVLITERTYNERSVLHVGERSYALSFVSWCLATWSHFFCSLFK